MTPKNYLAIQLTLATNMRFLGLNLDFLDHHFAA